MDAPISSLNWPPWRKQANSLMNLHLSFTQPLVIISFSLMLPQEKMQGSNLGSFSKTNSLIREQINIKKLLNILTWYSGFKCCPFSTSIQHYLSCLLQKHNWDHSWVSLQSMDWKEVSVQREATVSRQAQKLWRKDPTGHLFPVSPLLLSECWWLQGGLGVQCHVCPGRETQLQTWHQSPT